MISVIDSLAEVWDTFIELDVIDFADSYVGYVIQIIDAETKTFS